MSPVAQLFPQLGVVINFAVEDEDCITVLALHGLVAAFQIDDPETHGPEGNRLGLVEPLLVRSAMCKRVGRTPDASRICFMMVVCKTSNSAQVPVSSSHPGAPVILRPSFYCSMGKLYHKTNAPQAL